MSDKQNELRKIPSVDRLLSQLEHEHPFSGLPHKSLLMILRQSVQQIREGILLGRIPQYMPELIRQFAEKNLISLSKPCLRKVINATGVVLHTNLGRAPASERSIKHVAEVMSGYSTLEYDLVKGERGSRYDHLVDRLAQLTGAEAALIVNNNAAAVLLILTSLAKGREAIVSRGELVEIGGSFRIPEVMKQSGTVLKEVGTTNKTHLTDYENAIGNESACILKVHTSNFRIIGFTSRPDDRQICELAHRKGLLAINDLGSGTLIPVRRGHIEEPTIMECVSAGYDLVAFSGDKLLGAGQAGIIVGKRELIEQMKKEPLLRALRIDKLSLAALEGTLIDYSLGEAEKKIPVWNMLQKSVEDLKIMAQSIASKLSTLEEIGWEVSVVSTASLAGGGSLPAVDIEGYGVALTPAAFSTAELEARLRAMEVPVISIVRENRVILDVRCIGGEEDLLCRQILEMVK